MLQNYLWVKGPFKMQDRPIDFNITEYEELIDMIPHYTLQLTFRKLNNFSNFGVISRKNSHSYLEKLLSTSPFSNYIPA